MENIIRKAYIKFLPLWSVCVCARCWMGRVGVMTVRVSCFWNRNNRILYSFQMATTREEKKAAFEKNSKMVKCVLLCRGLKWKEISMEGRWVVREVKTTQIESVYNRKEKKNWEFSLCSVAEARLKPPLNTPLFLCFCLYLIIFSQHSLASFSARLSDFYCHPLFWKRLCKEKKRREKENEIFVYGKKINDYLRALLLLLLFSLLFS